MSRIRFLVIQSKSNSSNECFKFLIYFHFLETLSSFTMGKVNAGFGSKKELQDQSTLDTWLNM